MGKTLSIETGARCNNRCEFCYQLRWRDKDRKLLEPDRETLLGKLDWGIANGYDAVGFSGGEATIRKDFEELVARASGLGYGRISLTTNGRRFSNSAFARRVVEAGLDSIGWSLHGPDADTHDGLVGREGAFRQVVEGIRNVREVAAQSGRRVDQNLFILVNRVNVSRLADVCRLGRSLGIRLMILQPVIYAKGNLAAASRFMLELDELVPGVGQAAAAGLEEGWFVKLYNLPPCFFPHMLEAFEHQRYPVNIFRFQERRRVGEVREVAGLGYVRLDRCPSCLLQAHCPGLHQSLIPQETLLQIARDSLAAPGGVEELWLAGTELMEVATLQRFLRWAREHHQAARLKLYYGGDSACGDRFMEAVLGGGVTELCLVLSGLERQSGDVVAMSGGNGPLLRAAAGRFRLLDQSSCRLSVTVPYVDQATDAGRRELLGLAGRFAPSLEVHLPDDFIRPSIFQVARFLRLFTGWYGAGGTRGLLVAPRREGLGSPFFRHPVGLVADLAVGEAFYAPHFFSGPLAGWATLSSPPFTRRPAGEEEPPEQPELGGLPGAPIDEELLGRMRPG